LSSFEPYCQISGLETVPLKLDYWWVVLLSLTNFKNFADNFNDFLLMGGGMPLVPPGSTPEADAQIYFTL
jgi:hypothetical protein